MTTKTIPEQKWVVCDACGLEMPEGRSEHRELRGVVSIASMKAAKRLDFCDPCYAYVTDRLFETISTVETLSEVPA